MAFLPAGANQWSSAVYKVDRNADGSFTYFGAAGDFNLGEGRSSIDLYKVKLPAPPVPRTTAAAVPAASGTAEQGGVPAVQSVSSPTAGTPSSGGEKGCTASAGLRFISATAAGRGLKFAFAGDGSRADVDVFQVSVRNRVLTERLVARFANRTTGFRWNGVNRRTRTAAQDGSYIVRYRLRGSKGGSSSLRLALQRRLGRFVAQPDFERRGSCSTLQRYKLERPVFGGIKKTPLRAAIRLTKQASVGLVLLRGGKVVKTLPARTVRPNRTARLSISPAGLKKGFYEVRITVREGRRNETATLSARRL